MKVRRRWAGQPPFNGVPADSSSSVRVASAAASILAALTVLVWLGATRAVDISVREWFRPNGVWGEAQRRADLVVEGLRPVVTLALLLVTAAAVSCLRRSLRPAVHALLIGIAAGLPTLVIKVAMARTDPYGNLSSIGSFPSGHVTFVIVVFGGLLLLLQVRPRWWHWSLVGAAAAGMAIAMLLQAAHWFTDVLGGGALGACVLGLLSLLPSEPMRRSRPPAAQPEVL